MPLKTIEIAHRPGRHCGSSAVRDLLEYHGHNFSEAFCFGLGAGLGITYIDINQGEMPYIVHVRSMSFEPQVFETLRVPFKWQTFDTKRAAALALQESLSFGIPALLLTDIYHLPYFETQTHFPGHAIVAWKLDPVDGGIYVTDTGRIVAIKVPEINLSDARFSVLHPFFHEGNMFAPESIEIKLDKNRIFDAIRFNARTLMGEYSVQGENFIGGLPAVSKWINEIPKWLASENPRWLFRFAYQVIEKRGTGGGGFRLMYADFLKEVEPIVPKISALGLTGLMRECAMSWTALAELFKKTSELETLMDSSMIFVLREALERVYKSEQSYIKAVLKA